MWYNSLFNIWIDPKSPTRKKIAQRKNGFVFKNEFSKLTADALHRYKIEGVPDTVSERVVLESLLFYGYVFFFKKNGNVLALPGLPDGSGINAYGDYAGAYVYGANGYNEHITLSMPGAEQSQFLAKTVEGTTYKDGVGVMVRENPLLYPFINTTYYFAECIADTYRTADVCRQNIKRPFIIVAEESVIPTVKKYFEDVGDNMNYVVSSGVFPADKITVQPFDNNPDYVKVASSLIDWYEQKYRERCGFKNMGGQIDKKGENLLTSEVTANDEYTDLNTDQVLKYINQGLDQVNKAFGTNMHAEGTAENGDDKDIRADGTGKPGDVSGDGRQGTPGDNL